MRINNNLMAMNTHRQLGSANLMGAKSMEKLSSGFRINRAGDDAAGLAISEKMRGQIRGLNQASRNAQDGISMIQTAEGALNETHAILQRMRELAVQGATDTNTADDRAKLQAEMNQLTSEINRIGNTTEFNTQKLINGDQANNFTSVNNNSITGVVDGGTNLSAALADATAALPAGIVAGANTLDIEVVRVDRTGAVTFNHESGVSYTGATTFTFDGNIAVDSSVAPEYYGATTAIVTTWVITLEANDQVRVSSTSTAAGIVSSNDVFNLNSDGSFTFDQHGITFTIADFNNAALGTTATFEVNSGTTEVNAAQPTATLTSPSTAVVTVTTVSADVDALAGTYTLSKADAAATTTFTLTVTDMFGNESIVDSGITGAMLSAGFTTHGITLEFDGVAALTATMSYVFSVSDSYDVNATLNNATSSVTILSGYDGASTAAQTLTFAGLDITNSGAIENGQITFTAVEDVTESGANNSVNFQIGANQGQALNLSINDMRAQALNISSTTAGTLSFQVGTATQTVNLTSTTAVTDGTNATAVEYAIDLGSFENATKAITVINNALETVSEERSKLGANQNRLEYTIRNLDTSAENLQASESRIRDVDMAQEMMEFTKNNILQQAAQAMLAQANQAPQGVLQLLR